MSAVPTTPEELAAAHLTEAVAIPAFTAKLAADYGVNPAEIAASDLRKLSDDIYTAASRYLTKQAAVHARAVAGSVKAAIDTAFAVAGVPAPSTVAATDAGLTRLSGEFVTAPGVKEAADLLVAARTAAAKQAMGDYCPPAKPENENDDEETEEEKEEKKKKEAAVASVAA